MPFTVMRYMAATFAFGLLSLIGVSTHASDQTEKLDPWPILEHSTWIAEGDPKAPNVVYVFTDTECRYCRKLWQALQPYLERGQIQTRHIMVAVIADESAGRAAAVLGAKNPSLALRQNEDETLKLEPATAIPATTLKKLSDNETLMHEMGVKGTPALVYRAQNGRATLVQGTPPADVLAKIAGG